MQTSSRRAFVSSLAAAFAPTVLVGAGAIRKMLGAVLDLDGV